MIMVGSCWLDPVYVARFGGRRRASINIEELSPRWTEGIATYYLCSGPIARLVKKPLSYSNHYG